MELDAIAAVEACYAPAEDEERWLEGIVRALGPIDAGRGVYAVPYDVSGPEGVTIAPHPVAVNPDPEWIASAWAATVGAPPALLRALYRTGNPVALASEQLKRLPASFRNGYAPPLSGDILGIFAADFDRRGILLSVPLPCNHPKPGPRLRHVLAAIAAHVLAGRRLRSTTAPSAVVEPATADAVLAPGGRLIHARGEATNRSSRTALSGAVRALDRARSHARRLSPAQAVELWQGLVTGTWSLVDTVDTDGKRFVLARRNAPGVRDPKALTQGERDVLGYAALGHANKYIAYVLGIAPSTVSARLVSAQRKLGLRSRAELIRTFAVSEAPG